MLLHKLVDLVQGLPAVSGALVLEDVLPLRVLLALNGLLNVRARGRLQKLQISNPLAYKLYCMYLHSTLVLILLLFLL